MIRLPLLFANALATFVVNAFYPDHQDRKQQRPRTILFAVILVATMLAATCAAPASAREISNQDSPAIAQIGWLLVFFNALVKTVAITVSVAAISFGGVLVIVLIFFHYGRPGESIIIVWGWMTDRLATCWSATTDLFRSAVEALHNPEERTCSTLLQKSAPA